MHLTLMYFNIITLEKIIKIKYLITRVNEQIEIVN